MLKKVYWNSLFFEFSDEDNSDVQNVFTVIVGKNGTGKSQLLRAIALRLCRDLDRLFAFENERFARNCTSQTQTYTNVQPSRVIAVSTSPFDKFPFPKRSQIVITSDIYTYFGLRGMSTRDLGFSYTSRVINGLIESISKYPDKARAIYDVLRYLGYNGRIRSHFSLSMSKAKWLDITSSLRPEESFISYLEANSSTRNIDRSYFMMEGGGYDEYKINKAIKLLNSYEEIGLAYSFHVDISELGLLVSTSAYKSDDILFLIYSGLLSLKKIALVRSDNRQTIYINEASSGEQSIAINFMAIASKIEDNSIVLIDEPEICLHPEWQERYIPLLQSSFGDFKNCHFIIATHSPQIVSNLTDENCYVMSMEDRIATPASSVINKSIDFQLAHTFKSPGHRNEYLSRELISFLTDFGSRKEITQDRVDNISRIIKLEKTLEEYDPVRQLILMAKEVVEGYF